MIIPEWTGQQVKALRRTALRWTQERLAEELGCTDRTLRKWERADQHTVIDGHLADQLDRLLAGLTDTQAQRFALALSASASTSTGTDIAELRPTLEDVPVVRSPADRGEYREITDMHRRSLLRLLTLTTTALATRIDWDRLHFVDAGGRIDALTVDLYAGINQALWQEFRAKSPKSALFPAVHDHLTDLVRGVRDTRDTRDTASLHARLCALTGEVLQLAGEILFDSIHYPEAAHCYALASSLASKAGARDLYAAAMTRHAYLELQDHNPRGAMALLDPALHIATQGDSALPTRQWVASVRAQTLATLGDSSGCEHSFDLARTVTDLPHSPTLGWLRFDGTRIDEEHASCSIQLGRPDAAEALLMPLLDRSLSPRRHGSILIDLAAAAALRRDPVPLVWFGGAATQIARDTRSGYLARRLAQLHRHLHDLRADPHIDHLGRQIATLATTPR
ncbi:MULTISPECIES: helix-turn-helix transcriptional regulator [unclassified Nocardia]|uniref:helix-turn-helix domain-containing protein n=1 Tax=unclassified Nocardia TaxID=2637762 RepID=UPI001CE4A24E|nr:MULTISPECIES: helix-turn-helix transcriptional regulator [unclassified Nocardia]